MVGNSKCNTMSFEYFSPDIVVHLVQIQYNRYVSMDLGDAPRFVGGGEGLSSHGDGAGLKRETERGGKEKKKREEGEARKRNRKGDDQEA